MNFTKPIIIGLEIHAELNTDSKLFCPCPTKGDETPNSRTCAICLGMPGSKPTVNKKAINYGEKIALALNCRTADNIVFSRKSYFYPDMAKNYQITQYEIPLGEKGVVELKNKKIAIKRVHLEEDPASLVHTGGIENSPFVLVDYNRSGNPLCEIVTEPEIESPEEAREFMKTLITILRYLNVFDPSHNIIKADANISIKESCYVRAEIKNISGFREIERALSYEIERQKNEIREGHSLRQETRAWNAEKGVTSLLRTKETEEDYGYIFDPDLVPIEITKEALKKLKSEMPELPHARAKRYAKEYKISEEDAFVITDEYGLAEIFEKAIKKVSPILAARWIRRELVRVLNYNKIDVSDMKINEEQFIKLLELVEKNKITEKIGQRMIEKLAVEDIDIEKYIKQNDMGGVADSSELEKFCMDAIAENPKAVSDFKSGRQEALNFLLGSVMKKSKGKADAKEVREVLIKNIK
jgi:aspartyl-tRNA(Asn)/glutamyl-tRNA(Gln) amidotransferase subunit B